MRKEILLDVEGLNIYMKENDQVYQACSEVNFRIPRETTVSIVGESGCGKSLTCSAVMGLLNPPKWKVEGRMVFEGEPLAVWNDRFMNRIRGNAVSLVAQDPMSAFDQRMTILSHFMEIRGNRLKSKKEVLRQAEELLFHMNIRTPKDVLKCYPFQLSGGMLQRVLIAMAVSASPSLLIADEPTTALDVTNQQELLHLLKKMKEDPAVVAITSGTPTVLGFTEDKRKEAGKQFVDVGIAEETAVALASGIAANGGKPVYGVYSTFVQRTYDQIAQDLCINNSPATIVTFWGSVYGMNDVTHLGLYDIPMMANIPNLIYLAPTTKEEYLAMLEWSVEQNEYPVAIRLPGGAVVSDGKEVTKDFSKLNKYEVTQEGKKVAVIGLGTFYGLGKEAADAMEAKFGTKPTVINPYYITGVDAELLDSLKKDHDVVITLEDGILDGGFGEKIARFYGDSTMKVLNFGLKKEFLDRYDAGEVMKANHLTVEQIVEDVEKLI